MGLIMMNLIRAILLNQKTARRQTSAIIRIHRAFWDFCQTPLWLLKDCIR